MQHYLAQANKYKSRDLWSEAFPEDSKQYDDYYFSERTKGNRILAEEEDNRILSMIHLNPYYFLIDGRNWHCDYIVGVATRLDSRHQGHMRRLLQRMMADMYEEHMPFCFLMPASEAIYKPFDFRFIYDQPHLVLNEDGVKLQSQFLMKDGVNLGYETFLPMIAEWMEDYLKMRYEVHAIRDVAYVKAMLMEIQSERGTFRLLYDQGRLIGMEGEWGLEKRVQRLLYVLNGYSHDTEETPAIMARIIDLKEFVRVIRLQESAPVENTTMILHVTDSLIPGNQGFWLWHLTKETSWLEKAGTDGLDEHSESIISISISDLTQWLFGYRIPERLMGSDSQTLSDIKPLKGVFLDEVV